MNRQPDSASPQVSTPTADQRPDTGRRRFIVAAGLAAAPLIVTLTARPAEAGGVTGGSLGNYGSGIK